ncbi:MULTISPECIES: hypothetical protein [unclassified Lysobacter]|uniref:hypothetical protein n=1 Tax=unclassified Lysobacter TaxID=2635362 RepID=UPI0006FF88C6|nr:MULTISPECIES: hypothetical protein [unclassified Lysobacter]KQZ59362.1 hypothetical protein ASD53_07315 [Lysobacter sp. Root559]KRC34588.1 hypothetical protein ASE10_07730 [Lysobacter sp. Root76]KRD65894.1 hypothetical protein ASE45_18075 [Lysobacter sp. Root96]
MKLRIVKRWQDDDGMVELELHAETRDYATRSRFYTYPDRLMRFAHELVDFSGATADRPCFEEGSQEGTSAYWIRLRALAFDARGHSLLQLSTVRRGDVLERAAFDYSSEMEVAAINRLGTTLVAWIEVGADDFVYEP